MEVYKDVPGHEGLFQASNLGNIRSLPRVIKSGRGLVDRYIEGVVYVQSVSANGYRVISTRIKGKAYVFTVHRLVAKAWIGLSNLPVDHVDGDKQNNKIENLRYCTYSQNSEYYHAARKDKVCKHLGISYCRFRDRYLPRIKRFRALRSCLYLKN